MSPASSEPAGYAAALRELETILAELERDTVDVDALATKVRRAAELVEYCRNRITRARAEVETVMDAVAGPATPPPEP